MHKPDLSMTSLEGKREPDREGGAAVLTGARAHTAGELLIFTFCVARVSNRKGSRPFAQPIHLTKILLIHHSFHHSSPDLSTTPLAAHQVHARRRVR